MRPCLPHPECPLPGLGCALLQWPFRSCQPRCTTLSLQNCLALALHHPIHRCMASSGWLALTLSCLLHRLGAPRRQSLSISGSQALYRQLRPGPCLGNVCQRRWFGIPYPSFSRAEKERFRNLSKLGMGNWKAWLARSQCPVEEGDSLQREQERRELNQGSGDSWHKLLQPAH